MSKFIVGQFGQKRLIYDLNVNVVCLLSMLRLTMGSRGRDGRETGRDRGQRRGDGGQGTHAVIVEPLLTVPAFVHAESIRLTLSSPFSNACLVYVCACF